MQPRFLLVPEFTEMAWTIKPQLAEWAEVASYDPPGVGEEPVATLSHEAVAERGLAEWDDRGWHSCFVAADSWAIPIAVRIATRRPKRVLGLVLGHASLSHRRDRDRPPINEAIWSAMTEMIRTDSEAFIRNAIVQLTQGSYDEGLVRRMLARYPQGDLEAGWLELTRPDIPFGETLKDLDLPLLLGKHEDCLLHTDEGYEDAVAAFPEAWTVKTEDACCTDPRFGEAMREFCLAVLAADETSGRAAGR
jgi:pimeloyl-ACP methyl ester carboxylesterase